MNEITHDQARRFLMAEADGLLGDGERRVLKAHLQSCATCRAEAEQLKQLQRDLRDAFHNRWDRFPLPAKPLITQLPSPEPLLYRLGRIGINLVLLLLWIWLYRAVFDYFGIIFTHEDFRTNQILLVAVLILVYIQFRQQRLRISFDALPQIHWPGLALLLGCSVVYLLVERYLDINTLSATLFGLATYGFVGLWMSPRRWLNGLPAALLLIGILPFGEHLQTFVGYPMRVATAGIVQKGLNAVGIQSVGVDTILVMESGFAQVDLPCSGVKSLWTGMLFLIAATWLERRAISLRWVGITFLMGGMLFLINVARVAVLVLVDQVLGWDMVANLIHVPLGVLAFLVVCAVSLFLLRRLKQSEEVFTLETETKPQRSEQQPTGVRPVWLAPLLAFLITFMALLYTPRPETAAAQATIQWDFPTEMNVMVNPLSPGVYTWLTGSGADFADRWDFNWTAGKYNLEGSMMFLTSDTWRGQHRPERCFEVEGNKVESSFTVMYADDFPARMVRLSQGPMQVSAIYWLQTGNRVTDDFATRIWADLAPERQRWVLVTIVLDDIYPPDSAAIQQFVEILRSSVAYSLEGGLP